MASPQTSHRRLVENRTITLTKHAKVDGKRETLFNNNRSGRQGLPQTILPVRRGGRAKVTSAL